MAAGDLATIDDVKRYLGGDVQSNDDAVLSRLIAAASTFFTTACARPILLQTYSDIYDGTGGTRLHLRNTPVAAVTSVVVDTIAIPAAPAVTQSGWMLSGNVVALNGYRFCRGAANVAVGYGAGFTSVPADVAEAVVELVGLRYRGRDRLGKMSEGLGGIATTSYSQRDVSAFVASVITRYSRANLA